MKLTKAQERAKAKLTREWQCADELGESLPTLEGLVARKVAIAMEYTSSRFLGRVYMPRKEIKFRLAA